MAFDDDNTYHAALDKAIAMMSREQQGMMQRVLHGVAFNKWFGSDRDAPDGGGGDALVFSHGSMSYVRCCCAALEGLTPAGDAGVVTIV